MVTRRIAKETAVKKQEDDDFIMDYEDNNVADHSILPMRNAVTPDWLAEFDAHNSPPFQPLQLEENEIDNEMELNNIQFELPIQLDHYPMQPIDHPLILPLPAVDPIEDIVDPKTPAEKKELVRRFRKEVWEDEMKRIMGEHGMDDIEMDVHDIDVILFIDAFRNVNAAGTTPVMLVGDIARHDWTRDGNCVYTLRSVSKKLAPPRGTAENLDTRYLGVKRALWQYWAHRPAVHIHHIESYCRHVGHFAFYHAIMLHHLPERQWLALWRIKRVSRRD